MNTKRVNALLLLSATLVTGCGADKPQPPKSLCGVKTPASAVAPLLPEEGERVTQEKEHDPSAENACAVSVDDRFLFQVKHDPDGERYSVAPSGSTVPKPPRTFEGKLGVGEMRAHATATCSSSKKVFAAITLNVSADEYSTGDSRADLEKFLNAYMPNVQKHYGCKN